MDWKTGKFRPWQKSNMRKELATYKYLVDKSGLLDKPVKYLAMYFIDEDYLFIEEAKEKTWERTKKEIETVREKIKNEEFECKCGGRFCIMMTDFEDTTIYKDL